MESVTIETSSTMEPYRSSGSSTDKSYDASRIDDASLLPMPATEKNMNFSTTRSRFSKWYIGILIGVKVLATFALFLLGDLLANVLSTSIPLTANTHYFTPSGILWRFSQFLQIIAFIQLRYIHLKVTFLCLHTYSLTLKDG